MSTVVVFNISAHGHINPTLPLVAELVRRGERIIYYAGETFRKKIEQTGAVFRCYSHSAGNDPGGNFGGPFGLMAHMIETTEKMLPQLHEELCAERPDYLILDSMCVWGNLLQQMLGCPAVTSCTTFALNDAILKSMRRSSGPRPPISAILFGIPMLMRYFRIARRIDRRYGTRSPGLVDFFCNRQALNLVFTSRDVQPYAELFDESYKFVGPSIAARHEEIDFPFDQLGSDPVVYISMGTIFNNVADFYRSCFAAFAGWPSSVVMSIGSNVDEAALGDPPANVIMRRYVPQLEVLERAALFVSHGGMNSVSEALLYGVPLIVVPQIGDQYIVANRVQELGAGLSLQAAQVTPERLKALAERVLSNPEFARRAQALGETLRAAGGYMRAADEIIAFKGRAGLSA